MSGKAIHRRHVIAELEGLDSRLLNDKAALQKKLDALSERLNLTVVNRFSHVFNPFGLTIVYVLAESHLAVHSWPENGYIHLDLFTCSPKTNLSNFEREIKMLFDATAYKIRKVRYA